MKQPLASPLSSWFRVSALALMLGGAACSDDGETSSSHKTNPNDPITSADGGHATANGSTPGTAPTSTTPGTTPDTATEAKCETSSKRYGMMGLIECAPVGMEGKTSTPAGLVVALHGY